jgi:hypothetical protein
MPSGYRVAKTPVLGGLHHEYRLERCRWPLTGIVARLGSGSPGPNALCGRPDCSNKRRVPISVLNERAPPLPGRQGRFLGSGGLPGARDFHRQSSRNPARCQRTKVLGLTIASAPFQEKTAQDDQRKLRCRRGPPSAGFAFLVQSELPT